MGVITSGTGWGNYGNTGASGYGGSYGGSTPVSSQSAPQGNWLSNNWQQLLGAGVGAYNAYNAYQGASDARDLQQQAMQPQDTDTQRGWNLGGLGGIYDYFASEIPNIYQWTANQYSGMPGGARGPGGASSGLAADMAAYARADDPMMQAGRDYLTGTVSGQTQNPYLDATFRNAQGGNLQNFYDSIMGGMAGGGGGWGGGGGSARGALLDPSQHQQFLEGWSQDIMSDPLSGELAQRLATQSSDAATDAYNQATAAANRNAEMSGAFGSSGLVNQRGVNAGQFGQALYDAQTMAAMQLLDRGLAGSGQAAGMQNTLTGANAAITNANTGAAASNYGVNAGLQGQMAGLALQAAMGQQGYMGDMASLMSMDQRSAAGMIPGYHDVGMSDLERAFGANMQLDQMRGNAANSRRSHAMQMAQMPWQNLQSGIGMLNQLTPYMGQQYSQSTMPGQYPAGGMMPNPGMAAVGGGMQGYQDIMGLFGGGGGGA